MRILLIFMLVLGFCLTIVAAPDNYQQYMLELINRARANANAEATLHGLSDANEGPPSCGADAWNNPVVAQPLSWNDNLLSAADGHANNLDSVDWFFNGGTYGGNPHTPTWNFPGTTDPADTSTISERIAAAGYTEGARTTYSSPSSCSPGAENIAMGLAAPANGWSDAEKTSALKSAHSNLFVDAAAASRGHRNTMLLLDFKEIGLGMSWGTDNNGSDWDAHYIVQKYGVPSSSTQTFLTGVAFNDTKTVDNFYSPGEGIGNLSLSVLSTNQLVVGTGVTWGSGGYTIDISSLSNATYILQIYNGTNYIWKTFTKSGYNNIKLDAMNPVFVPMAVTYMKCPDNIIITNWNDVPPINTEAVDSVSDCGENILIHAYDVTSGVTIVRTYVALDACGQTDECEQRITFMSIPMYVAFATGEPSEVHILSPLKLFFQSRINQNGVAEYFLHWKSKVGYHYRVENSMDLAAKYWDTYRILQSEGTNLSVALSSNDLQGFYRIVELPDNE